MPLDYDKLISQEYRRRPKPAIRSLLSLEKKPDMISFLAGKPNPERFPFESITVRLKSSAVESSDPSTGEPTELVVDGDTLERVLQYGSTSGDPLFDEALNDIVSVVHGRTRHDGTPAGDFDIAIGTGSQDLLAKVCTMYDSSSRLASPCLIKVIQSLSSHRCTLGFCLIWARVVSMSLTWIQTRKVSLLRLWHRCSIAGTSLNVP